MIQLHLEISHPLQKQKLLSRQDYLFVIIYTKAECGLRLDDHCSEGLAC